MELGAAGRRESRDRCWNDGRVCACAPCGLYDTKNLVSSPRSVLPVRYDDVVCAEGLSSLGIANQMSP